MFDKKYFDEYVGKINHEDMKLDCRSTRDILNMTMNKIADDSARRISKVNERWRNISYVAAACIILILISGLIPSSPVHALYQRIFKIIPGFGVVKSEEYTGVYLATEKTFKLPDEDGILKVKYAYASSNSLYISVVTDMVFYNKDIKLNNETSEYNLGLYVIVDDEKIYLDNYSMTGKSLITGALIIEGAIELNQRVENDKLLIGVDGIDSQLEFQMISIKENILASDIGNTLYIDEFLIFADVNRIEDVVVVRISSVLPEEYSNCSVYLPEGIKEMFDSGISIIDESGNLYFPNDVLRKENNDSTKDFYFEIPENITSLTLKIPQIFYETIVVGEAIVEMPRSGDYIFVNESYNIGTMEIIFKGITVISIDDAVSKKFGEETLRLDFEADIELESNHKVLRIVPNIEVKNGFEYMSVSSSAYIPYWEGSNQSGSYYTVFDNMKKTSKVLVEVKAHNVINGPFEIKLDE